MTERKRRAIREDQHNWLDKEYAVAIYMALYSNDYKVWIYNHNQCANIFDMPVNAMKMMVDNFRAYAGKNRLGTSCPKMQAAFEKYKEMPKGQLAKLAIDYIEERWNLTRLPINVESYLRKIGKAAFIECYEIFEQAARDSDWQETYIEKLPERWNKNGRTLRVTFSILLFKCKRQKEALQLIAKSPRMEKEIIEKAKRLLNN